MTADPFASVRRQPEPSPWPAAPLLAHTAVNPAKALGVSQSTLNRYMTDGMSDWEADRAAIRIGLHPVELWGWAWIEAALTPAPPVSAPRDPNTPETPDTATQTATVAA